MFVHTGGKDTLTCGIVCYLADVKLQPRFYIRNGF